MNLYSRFENFLIHDLGLDTPRRIMIAVSGGMDSMVLLNLFQKSNHSIAVAHCNFGLRGTESDEEHEFIRQYCKDNEILLFDRKFDILHYADTNKKGIQESARELRYTWFDELLSLHDFDHVATAHHLNDMAETVLFNIARGTGIAGLHGIPAINKKVIRPLLFATRTEIAEHALTQKVHFRTDSSNQSNKYARNRIRNSVIPVLKEINPLFEEHIRALTQQVSFIEKIYRSHIDEVWKRCHQDVQNRIEISISSLLGLNSPQLYLFEFLCPYGFNHSQVSGIIASLNEQSGKKFYSRTHLLVKDRHALLLSKYHTGECDEKIIEADAVSIKLEHALLTFERVTPGPEMKFTANSLFVDADLIAFPLKLRQWSEGDKFIPLGMSHRKKVSDFFTDEKINLIDKNNSRLLVSAEGDTICLMPYRIDDRFKVTSQTKHILKLTLQAG